ncbi:DUF4142 domain-containing protein [Lysobacter korlensis]|uniref:DUF4142 domain-containing protein n=1 Tax=Lysobacter korlensis TaxID=553636 RepID=A0ABV6RIX4_9GAMM
MKTKNPLILSTAVLSMALLAACGGEREGENNAVGDEDVTVPAETNTAMVDDPTATASVNDPLLAEGAPVESTTPVAEGDALGMIIVVNEHEVAAADQAVAKKVSAPVKTYADMMRTEHTANMEQARTVAGTAGVQVGDGPEVGALRTRSEATRTQLNGMEGTAFEQGYVDAMIKDHQMTLQMLDQRLIPGAQNAAIKQYLQTTREAVAKHLEAAQQLRSQIGGAAAPGATTPGQAQPTPASQS